MGNPDADMPLREKAVSGNFIGHVCRPILFFV